MKACVMTDLEGVAGVVCFDDQTGRSSPYYEEARRLLTAEVSAAVDGLLDAGLDDVLVIDGHGPGGISFVDLHPKATLLHGRPRLLDAVFEQVEQCDVCMFIGQHAMAGGQRANLNHTQNSRTVDYYKLNDRPIGEIAQFSLLAGAADVPVIFLSGDTAACQEAEELIPGITTAAVKTGIGRNVAVSCSADEARKRIREGVKLAVKTHRKNPVAPLKWPGPYVLEKRFFQTDSAGRAAAAVGAERVDAQTVRLRADDIRGVIYR